MSGNAYQLRFNQILQVGTYVIIDGPHDKYGKVYGHDGFIGDPDGTIHLVRGIGNQMPKGKVAHSHV